MRSKTTSKDLPPRMLRRTKRLVSGKVWEGVYYNGRGEDGRRVEIPLGSDIAEAKRKWAELECKPVPSDVGVMRFVFDRYERDVVPSKAPRTQKDNIAMLAMLRSVFNTAPINAITPQHIAQYRDSRKSKAKGAENTPATVRANREITLFSHVWNMAREWGYTSKDNPCRGVRKHKEQPRDFYADDQVWTAVYGRASAELQDAMDLAYLTGQRPADVLKMLKADVQENALLVRQNKTKKLLRILLNREDGSRSKLGQAIDEIIARAGPGRHLISTKDGVGLNKYTLRLRFDAARNAAATELTAEGQIELAARIKQFKFRDIRPKAASEIGNVLEASKLLGHTEQEITKKVYIRVGESVNPTK